MLGGVVRGKLTTLRVPTEDDLPFVNAWMADMRVRRGGHLWEEPAALATWKARLAEVAKDHWAVLWTIEAEGRPIGSTRVHIERHVSWLRHFLLDPAAWGRGYGWDAALALHRYLFDYRDMDRVIAWMPADDAAGLRIAERLGYREHGRGHNVYFRDGRYSDEVWLNIDRATWDERWSATEREYAPAGVR